jgi:hypothetical protein
MDSAFGGFKTPLQRERKLRRWKQQQVIDRIKQLAHERGYRNTLDGFEVNALSRLENGRIGRPRDPLPELFAGLYDLPEEVLFPTHGSVWDAAVRVGNQGLGGLSLPSLIAAVDGIWAKLEALSAVLHLDPDMLRRQFLQLLAATGGGALLSPNGASERRLAERAWITALAQESAQFGRRMEAAEVGSVTPEQLERQVERLARDFLTQPAVPVVAELGYLRDQTFGLLEGHRYPHQWADLNVIAAKLCGLLATASSDRFGCYDAAANHLRTAWLCADKAGHSELKAWVLGIRSTVDFWLGNYQQAADRASEGRQYVSRGTELVRLGSLEARARGSLGDRNGVQEAVQLAASARETLDDADEARHIGIFAFPIANQVRCAGNAHMWLSDPRSIETARHELEEALRLFEAGIPHQSYAHIAVTRVDLTIVDLRLGQLDTAAATMQPVLGLPTDRRLAGVVRRSGELRRQLAAPQYRRASLARELGQAVEGFCASSVTRQLAGSTVR